MNELWPYLRLLAAERWRLAAGSALMVATAACSVGLLGLAGWFITATGVTALAVAAGAAMTLDIYTPGAGIRAFAIGRTVARYGERVLHHDAVLGILAALRARVFAALTRLDPATAARFSAGELLNRLTADVDALDQLYLRSIAPAAVAAAAIAAFALFVTAIDPALGAALGVGLIAVAAVLFVALAIAAGTHGAALVDHGERLRRDLLAAVDGLAELRAFGRWPRERHALAAKSGAQVSERERLGRYTALGEAVVTLTVHAAAAAALVTGLSAYAADERSLAMAVLVPLGVLGLAEILGMLPGGAASWGRTRTAAARLNRQLATEPVVVEATEPAPALQGNALVAEGLCFAHGPLADLTLDGVDLTLAEGETVVVTGPSGCGKSTLGDLCARLRVPDGGTIELGGVRLDALAASTLRGRIAYLRQRDHLFAETIAENLRIGDPEATDDQLWHALWCVDLDEAVAARPQGLTTWLGSGGAGLSGGEVRRLELARAWLTAKPVTILDEPFAGLDWPTATRIAERLFGHRQGRSLLVLGHEGTPVPTGGRHLRLAGGRLHSAA